MLLEDEDDELLVCSLLLELEPGCPIDDDVVAAEDEVGVFARNVRTTVGADNSERFLA